MIGVQLYNYDLELNIKKDDTGKITQGMVLGDILYQNQAIILSVHPGEIKDNPALGVGISDMTLDDDVSEWKVAIREAMEMDKQIVNTITLNSSEIDIDAKY